jgi:hypothetical protein
MFLLKGDVVTSFVSLLRIVCNFVHRITLRRIFISAAARRKGHRIKKKERKEERIGKK